MSVDSFWGMEYVAFEDWKEARILVNPFYRMLKGYPKYAMYGFSVQLHSLEESIPSNVADSFYKIVHTQ